MAYADIDDVREVLPGGVVLHDSANDPPTDAAVVEMIAEYEGEVNNAFETVGITTPVTDPNLVLKLSMKVSRRTAYEVMVIRGVSVSGDVKPLWLDWKTDYQDMITAILEGVISSATEGGEPWSASMDNEQDPAFKRGMVH